MLVEFYSNFISVHQISVIMTEHSFGLGILSRLWMLKIAAGDSGSEQKPTRGYEAVLIDFTGLWIGTTF